MLGKKKLETNASLISKEDQGRKVATKKEDPCPTKRNIPAGEVRGEGVETVHKFTISRGQFLKGYLGVTQKAKGGGGPLSKVVFKGGGMPGGRRGKRPTVDSVLLGGKKVFLIPRNCRKGLSNLSKRISIKIYMRLLHYEKGIIPYHRNAFILLKGGITLALKGKRGNLQIKWGQEKKSFLIIRLWDPLFFRKRGVGGEPKGKSIRAPLGILIFQ